MNIALFDFDGTITDKDTFSKFVFYVTPKNRLRLGRLVLLPTFIKYKLGLVKGEDIRAKILRFAFQGAHEANLKAQGQRYAEQELPNYLRPKAMERIQWHKDRGDTVVIVSASLDVYLKPWCSNHELDLICTEVAFKNGIATGFSLQGDCSSYQKQHRVLQIYNLDNFDSIYAYGDTPEDNELLSLASENKGYFCYFE